MGLTFAGKRNNRCSLYIKDVGGVPRHGKLYTYFVDVQKCLSTKQDNRVVAEEEGCFRDNGESGNDSMKEQRRESGWDLDYQRNLL